MFLAKLIFAPKMGKNKFLLPVRIIQSAALILAEGIACQRIENRLHGVSLHNLSQPLVIVIDETSLEFLFECQ